MPVLVSVVGEAAMPVRIFRMSIKRWLIGTLLVWLTVVGISSYSAYTSVTEAKGQLEGLRDLGDVSALGELDIGAVASETRLASDALSAAHRDIDSVVMRPLWYIPIVRTQIRSASAIVATGDEIVAAAVPVLEHLDTVDDYADTADKVEFGRVLNQHIAELDGTIAAADVGPRSGLVAPLVDAVVEFDGIVAELGDITEQGSVVLSGLLRMLDDSEYLILVGNNAEMRLGSGMYLSAGVLSVTPERLVAPQLVPTNELYPVPLTKTVDDDIEARWGFLDPTNDYRKLGYSARFADFAGPQALQMWERQTGDRPDGVLMVDPVALGALLTLTGPIDLGGRTIDSTNAAQYFLIDQYEIFGVNDSTQDLRHDAQATAAAIILGRLADGGWSMFDLLEALRPMVSARHVLAYSEDAVQQAAWDAVGVSGRLSGFETGVYVLNLTASKADPFIQVAVELKQKDQTITLDVSVTNNTPSDVSEYAAGAWYPLELQRGDYTGRLVVYAPAAAEQLSFDPIRSLEVFGPDGQVWVMGERITVLRGETVRRRVVYDLPTDFAGLTVLPSARFPGTLWTIDGEDKLDTGPISVDTSLGG